LYEKFVRKNVDDIDGWFGSAGESNKTSDEQGRGMERKKSKYFSTFSCHAFKAFLVDEKKKIW